MALIRSLPLGVKIVGIVSILLAMMVGALIYSYIHTTRTQEEVTDLTEYILPLVNAVANIEIRTLEQELHYERALRHLEAKAIITVQREAFDSTGKLLPLAGEEHDAEVSRVEMAKFEKLGKQVDAEIVAALAQIKDALEKVNLKEDAVALARVEPVLSLVERQHQEYQDHALELVDALEKGDFETFRRGEGDLEREEDHLAETLTGALMQLQQFEERQARRITEHEAELAALSRRQVWFALGAFLLGVLLAAVITRRLVRPIQSLTTSAQAVAAGELDMDVPVTTTDEVGTLATAFNQMLLGLRDREAVKDTFSKYVDPRVMRHLLDPGNADLSGERRIMTAFFSDMADFTSLSEKLTPRSMVKFVNAYLSEMSKPIRAEEGVIDKYIGDAVMAYWGPPFVDPEEQAVRAVRAALHSLARLKRFQQDVPEIIGLRTGVPTISVRIGIATGPMVVGNIGSDYSKNYTVMGDAVNVGARLEGACTTYGVSCLVSEHTREQVGTMVEFCEIDTIAVKGKEEALRVFEPLGMAGQVDNEVLKARDQFEDALGDYRARRWDQADAAFRALEDAQPGHASASVFLERIVTLRQSDPGAGWDGMWRMTTK